MQPFAARIRVTRADYGCVREYGPARAVGLEQIPERLRLAPTCPGYVGVLWWLRCPRCAPQCPSSY